MNLSPDPATLLLPFRNRATGQGRPFRVGVVLDDGLRPRWVDTFLLFLRGIPGIDVSVWPWPDPQWLKAAKPGWLMDRLYAASRREFDPFEKVEPAADGMASTGAERCEVMIWLAAAKNADVDFSGAAKYGAFTVRLGERNQAIPFWDEVAASQFTSPVTIYWHDSFLTRGRMVRRAETSTWLGLQFTRNAEEPLAAAMRMLATLCLELKQDAPRALEKFLAVPEKPVDWGAPNGYPSTGDAARFITGRLARSAYLRWKARGRENQWFVAVRPNLGASPAHSNGRSLSGFTPIPLPPGSDAMADPFLHEANGHTYLLFEDIPKGSARGRLACMELSGNGSVSETSIVLERDYHLSYPCVVPWNGELFLLPESSAAGRVELFRFAQFPSRTELVSAPVEGVQLTDTTPVLLDDRWYFFTTTLQPFLETHLFWASRLDGAWHLHPASPISGSVRNSRPAGNLFWKDERLFRPTQDCSVRYGYGIRINEVTRLTPTEFEEHAVSWIGPTWMPRLLGTHTWNESSRLQVIDGIRSVARANLGNSDHAGR